MSDLTALAQKLASLHSSDDRFEHGARIIAQGGVPSGMAAVLHAIDDTVLERQLEIMTGTHIVTLVAAGRRLRGIAGVVPPKGKSPRLAGEAISRDDKKSLAAVGELLNELLMPAPRLTLRSLPSGGFGRSGERGVAATDLISLWQVDMEAEVLPPIERFLSGNRAALKAFLHVRGDEVVATEGDSAQLQDLMENQLDAFLEKKAKLSGNADGPQLISLEGVLPGNVAVALAQAGDDIVLITYDPVALAQLHASWQAIFR